MADLNLLKTAAADVPNAETGRVRIFVDAATGEPSFKDDAGVTTTLKGVDGADGAAGATGAAGQGVPTGGTTGQVLAKIDGTDYNTEWVTPSGGGGTTLPTAHFQHLAALLEPAALEALQTGAFSYPVTTSPKYVIASFQTRLGSSGRMEVRNPQRPFRLRNVTLSGTGAESAAMILDPAAPTYADPVDTYYTRLGDLQSLDQKYLPIAANTTIPLLPGPYGSFISSVTCFDLAWLVLLWCGNSIGINLWDEISDTTTQRVGDALLMPISKKTCSELVSSSTGTGSGSVTLIDCPSTWAAITEPLTASYGTPTFRDDFMSGSSLDLTTWTRAQSTAGNVEYHASRPWVTFVGNSSWGANGLYKTTGQARSNGRKLVMDVYCGRGTSSNGAGMFGWSDGLGTSYTNLAHAINFKGSGGTMTLEIYENSTNRGTVGSGWTEGTIYRLYIEQTTTGAIYKIQGGTQYPAIGSGSWTTLSPGVSSSATATLTPGAAAWTGTNYIGDVRIFS